MLNFSIKKKKKESKCLKRTDWNKFKEETSKIHVISLEGSGVGEIEEMAKEVIKALRYDS